MCWDAVYGKSLEMSWSKFWGVSMSSVPHPSVSLFTLTADSTRLYLDLSVRSIGPSLFWWLLVATQRWLWEVTGSSMWLFLAHSVLVSCWFYRNQIRDEGKFFSHRCCFLGTESSGNGSNKKAKEPWWHLKQIYTSKFGLYYIEDLVGQAQYVLQT